MLVYDFDLIAKVCNLRFKENKSQKEISKILKISEVKVSRIINKAFKLGIIQFSIIEPEPEISELEREIEKKFNLKRVLISNNKFYSENEIKTPIGQRAARYLLNIINDGDIIGMSFGTTVKEVVNALPLKILKKIEVIQILGGSYKLFFGSDGVDLTKEFSERFNVKPHIIYAPLFVDSKLIKNAIIKDSSIKETISYFNKINIVLIGIGAFDPNMSSNLFKFGKLSTKEINELKDEKIVGDAFSHFFDINGNFCKTSVSERIIAIPEEKFLKINYRIGVAGGKSKIKAILGSIRGRIVNILVTDSDTGKSLMIS